METTKITRQKMYEIIADQIKNQIMNGALKPGERLPTSKELSERYQVGRSTVREALSALEVMGFIETRQGEGSTVKIFKPEDVGMPDFQSFLVSKETIFELMEARRSLEVSNAGLAAEKRTEEDLKKLQENLNRMELSIINEEDTEKWDMDFHILLGQATHNSIMVRLLETISDPMNKAMKEIRRITFDSPVLSKKVLDEHRRIFQAIANQDSKLAQQMMTEHLAHFEKEMKNYYQS